MLPDFGWELLPFRLIWNMGREPQMVTKTYTSNYTDSKTVTVELFTWEKLDYVDKIKTAFGL